MAGVFRFKQFSVDQSGCAMKINTDGVLLGALAGEGQPQSILDIGTGTGVIALMLAQRFTSAQIDAVEIDDDAAKTALNNFEGSPYSDRLKVYHQDFNTFFAENPEKRYDIIVTNPPFYIDALTSPTAKINQAKHADRNFFEDLIKGVSNHLTKTGTCWLVLPVNTAGYIKTLLTDHDLHLQKTIIIRSYADSEPHRYIIVIGKADTEPTSEQFLIYDAPKVYSQQYIATLKAFFIVF
ncbi:methyltransferase [Mucilaginibacter sp. UR6-1]|uniref:tRNA1(Val) (adenine(37)-N6)-methyltransferase n=1 Tax=Mucilaginibacter sp. UR6-1 TaxID=1435643 RepID=UPI001E5E9408|nr:methyltransferase [Mucilaginibacter sp. UR6-1]MCC8407492.1 methyltransferase [Mucilaginibacter sp. UR6-1]